MGRTSSQQRTVPDWTTRAFGISAARTVSIVVVIMAFSWAATYLIGGAGHIAPHWAYLPIMIAAARFGVAGALITAAVSAILTGPLMPLDVAAGTAQRWGDWTSRGAFFVGNGLILALLIGRLKHAHARELAVFQEELDLAQHKRAIIETVSHEFRTPLTILLATTDLIADGGIASEPSQEALQLIDRAVRRLDDLLTVVLAASGTLIEPGKITRTEVSLRRLCEEGAGAADGPERRRIQIEPSDADEIVLGDRELLAVPVRAVIDNALKFSPSDSPVTVRFRALPDAVGMSVHDRGPGMSEEQWNLALEPFTQQGNASSPYEQGLGLGLFAARKTVELIGGAIEMTSAPQGGTIVTLTVPRVAGSPPA